jgi:hypothetical protein
VRNPPTNNRATASLKSCSSKLARASQNAGSNFNNSPRAPCRSASWLSRLAIKRRRHRGVGGDGYGDGENFQISSVLVRGGPVLFLPGIDYQRTTGRSWRYAAGLPRLIKKSAADHQTAMARPPTTRKMTPRPRNGTRRHQRSKMTVAIATVPAPAKIDNKRTCGGLFRIVNCMASVFRHARLVTSTNAAGSLAQSGHGVDP